MRVPRTFPGEIINIISISHEYNNPYLVKIDHREYLTTKWR